MTPKITRLINFLSGGETAKEAKHRSDLHRAVQAVEDTVEKIVAEGKQRSERKKEPVEAPHV